MNVDCYIIALDGDVMRRSKAICAILDELGS